MFALHSNSSEKKEAKVDLPLWKIEKESRIFLAVARHTSIYEALLEEQRRKVLSRGRILGDGHRRVPYSQERNQPNPSLTPAINSPLLTRELNFLWHSRRGGSWQKVERIFRSSRMHRIDAFDKTWPKWGTLMSSL